MEEFLKIISALKDETRIKLLKFLLIHKELCVCELEASFDMLQSRLSRHLKILKDAGFLNSKRDGKKILYSIKKLDSFRKKTINEINNLEIDLPNLKKCRI
jgi:ArsR family transcriptional regulator